MWQCDGWTRHRCRPLLSFRGPWFRRSPWWPLSAKRCTHKQTHIPCLTREHINYWWPVHTKFISSLSLDSLLKDHICAPSRSNSSLCTYHYQHNVILGTLCRGCETAKTWNNRLHLKSSTEWSIITLGVWLSGGVWVVLAAVYWKPLSVIASTGVFLVAN